MEPVYYVVYDNLQAETSNAYLLLFENNEVWLPKSQVELHVSEHTVSMPEWLVIEHGLEEYIND